MTLILASKSHARQSMLKNAGLAFQAIPADIDEAALKTQNADVTPKELAALLAEEKALHISKQNTDAIVIGSDQILECEGEILSKAEDEAAAKEKLLNLRGKTHHLISAVSIAKAGQTLWQHSDIAMLTMQDFDETFLQAYCAKAGDALTHNVGAYAVEGIGVHLFESIEGDYFTILGMPLLPLLTVLRKDYGVRL